MTLLRILGFVRAYSSSTSLCEVRLIRLAAHAHAEPPKSECELLLAVDAPLQRIESTDFCFAILVKASVPAAVSTSPAEQGG